MGRLEELRTKKQYTIYRMWHPSTPGVRYVGLTIQPLEKRLFAHFADVHISIVTNGGYNYKHKNAGGSGSVGANVNKCNWFKSLVKNGHAPYIDELDTLYGTFKEARVLEDHWINFYLSDPHYTLLNMKLPKQTQTLVERKETPFVPEPFTYEQNKEILTITNVSRSIRDCDCDRESYDASVPYRSFCISGGESLYNSEPTGANKEQV